MKKIFAIMGLAAAATLAFTSCQKEAIENNEDTVETPSTNVPFVILVNSETKTVNDGLNTNWVAGDAITVFHEDAAATGTYYPTDAAGDSFTIASEDIASNRFTGTLGTGLTSGHSYNWYALYPYSTYVHTPANTSSGYLTIGSAASGAQAQTGNDSKSHIAGPNYPLFGKTAAAVAHDVTPSFTMTHASSLVEVKVTNNLSESLTVTRVTFTSPNDNLVGSYYIDFTGASPAFTARGESYVSKTATLNVNEGGAIAANGGTASFFLAVKPFTATTGQTLTVNVSGTTASGSSVHEWTKTLTADVPFNPGKIRRINVDYTTAVEPDYVTLDWNYAGGTKANLEAITGVTTSGLGSDYAEGNAPYRVKFDNSDDYIQVKTDARIGTVSIGYKMIGGNTTSYLNIFESADGSSWGERIDRLTISGDQNSTGTLTTTASFNAASRYVKIVFEKGANVGIGAISILKFKSEPGIKWTADGSSGDAVTEANASLATGPDTMPAAALYNPNSINLSEITFSSSDPSVATIGEHTGVLTLVGAGSTDISAVFAGNGTYKAANVKYTLSVTDSRTTPVITLTTTDVDLTDQNYGSFTGRTATVDPSVTLVYSKTDASGIIDDFNTSTGALTLSGNTGVATVTASFAGNDDYKPAVSQSYTIRVASSSGPEDRNAPGSPTITAISPTSFTATWTAPASGGSENGYSWKLSTSSDPADVAITNGTGNVDTGVLTVTVSSGITLTAGTDYYFHVLTRGDGGTNYNDSDYATSAAKQYKTYTMTIDSSNNGNNDVHWTATSVTSLSYNDITWSTSVTGTTSVTANTTYAQIGSKSNPATAVSLSTTGFATKKIISASVTCYCMSNTGPTVTITAGSTTMLNAAALVKGTSTTHNSTTGNVTMGASDTFSVSFTSSAKAAIVISQVQVIYCD